MSQSISLSAASPDKVLNPLKMLIKGVYSISNSGSALQVSDTNSTVVLAHLLTQMYNMFTPLLEKAGAKTQTDASAGNSNQLSADSTYYTELNDISNTATGQGQSAVTTQQNQASQDGTNCAKIIQLATSANQILSTNAQLLSN